MADPIHGGPAREEQGATPAPPGVWSTLHAGLGAVLLSEDGRLLDANPAALDLLGLAPADVGTRIGVRLAQIAVCNRYGPDNGVVAHCSQSSDERIGAHCVAMGATGAATTLYLLWDKDAVAGMLGP
jgi:hypothetical protein